MYAKNKVFESGEDYILDLLLDLGLGIKSANNTGGGQQSDPVGGGGSASKVFLFFLFQTSPLWI